MVGREVDRMYPQTEGAQAGGQPQAEGEGVVLSLRNLCCAAGGVRGVSFDVGAGEITALAGLVGAGRTELARVLFGLTPADAGQILFEGRPATIGSPRQAMALGIAYLPEDRRRHGLILDLSIAANISMAVHRRLFPRGWLRLGAERALALDFMRALAIKAPGPEAAAGSLSGGNQQKVALARWLAATPRLLILDEPTQGVNVAAKSEIHKLIRRLAAQDWPF